MVPKIVGDKYLKIALFRDYKSEEETGPAEEQPASNRIYQVRYKGFHTGGLL